MWIILHNNSEKAAQMFIHRLQISYLFNFRHNQINLSKQINISPLFQSTGETDNGNVYVHWNENNQESILGDIVTNQQWLTRCSELSFCFPKLEWFSLLDQCWFISAQVTLLQTHFKSSVFFSAAPITLKMINIKKKKKLKNYKAPINPSFRACRRCRWIFIFTFIFIAPPLYSMNSLDCDQPKCQVRGEDVRWYFIVRMISRRTKRHVQIITVWGSVYLCASPPKWCQWIHRNHFI